MATEAAAAKAAALGCHERRREGPKAVAEACLPRGLPRSPAASPAAPRLPRGPLPARAPPACPTFRATVVTDLGDEGLQLQW